MHVCAQLREMTLAPQSPEHQHILDRIQAGADALNRALEDAAAAGLRIDLRLTDAPVRVVASAATHEEGRRPCDLNSANDG